MAKTILTAIPVLHVTDAQRAEGFYCEKLGFKKLWEYRPFEDKESPVYFAVERDGVILNLSSFSGDGVVGSVVRLDVEDVDAFYAEFSQHDVLFDLNPYNQSWGNREMYLHDPDGNCLRFTQPIG
jgi:catechol 2,3-dioxygenase-like lactoylglutathione lyase family enzyme